MVPLPEDAMLQRATDILFSSSHQIDTRSADGAPELETPELKELELGASLLAQL
jgi:hypothetical protein